MRHRLSEAFAVWASFVYGHARSMLFISLSCTGVLALYLPAIELDTRTEGFLEKDDPALVAQEEFRQQFGRSTPILVVVESEDVLNVAFLNRLRGLHADLERSVPMVDDITSLVNVRSVRGVDGELRVHPLQEEWPTNDSEATAFRRDILSHPLYRDLLVANQARATSIVIRTEPYSRIVSEPGPGEGLPMRITPEEEAQIVTALLSVAQRHDVPGFDVSVSGSPILVLELQRLMKRDMQRFALLSIGTIAVFLYILFRRASGVLLPLLTVTVAVCATVGLMSMVGVPIRVPTQVLPSLLLAVGVCDSVHVLALFYRAYDAGSSKEEAISSAFAHTGLAVTMTTMTTAGGLSSFVLAELAPVAEFGVFGPIGVGLAFVYTLVMLPALVALVPLQRRPSVAAAAGLPDRTLQHVGMFATRRPRLVLAVTVVLLSVAAAGIPRVRLAHDPLRWLQPDNSVRVATENIDRLFHSLMAVDILIPTGEPDGVHEPDVLEMVDELAKDIKAMADPPLLVGKTLSLADIVKEIHQAMNDEDPDFYRLPDRREAIAQELLLFEGSGATDLTTVTDIDFSTARLTVRIPWVDAGYYPPFLQSIEGRLDELTGEPGKAVITGGTVIMSRTMAAAITSVVRSYTLCFFVITPLMMMLVGRRSGLISAVPNLTPIVLTLGVMGWGGIPLDSFTLLVACIAIGLAVDDTIHFLLGYELLRARGVDCEEAISRTLSSTGGALFVTSCVLAVGFFVFGFSGLRNLEHFGILIGGTIVTAFLADIVISPALLTLLNRRQAR